MEFEKIPLIISKDHKEKKQIAKILEQYFLDFINKTKSDPIDGILELCELKKVRIEDIEDYFDLMDILPSIIKNSKNNNNSLF